MQALRRDNILQEMRLVSGLILFCFVATHLLNHALGLFSIDLMQEVQQWRWIVTRSLVGSIVLGCALVTHVVLGLYRIATRATMRLPPWELIQSIGGVLIPFLLFAHIVNTRGAHELFGVNDIYLYELLRLWPASAISQSLMVIFVWMHGCLGIHFWLRLKPTYRRLVPILAVIAVIIPVAALGGFLVAGRGLNAIVADERILAAIKETTRWPTDAASEQLAGLRMIVRGEYAALLAVVAIYFIWTRLERRSAQRVTVSYIGGPTVTVPAGPSLLEISRMSKIPHASICGGRARCSTCRVRIEQGSTPLAPPKFAEAITLGRIRAPDNVRLACQIRPEGRLVVSRLIWPGTKRPIEESHADEADSHGVEKLLAVMVVDLRGFARLSEQRLASEIVSILNGFFSVIGAAITDNGGRIDKFIGDGLIAVFGESDGIAAGSRRAMDAARAIDAAVSSVNESLGPELGRTLDVGMGLASGPLVVGRMGFGKDTDLAVIGPAVGIARDIEEAAKNAGVQLMMTRELARHCGWEPPAELVAEVASRSAGGPIAVVALQRSLDLPALTSAARP